MVIIHAPVTSMLCRGSPAVFQRWQNKTLRNSPAALLDSILIRSDSSASVEKTLRQVEAPNRKSAANVSHKVAGLCSGLSYRYSVLSSLSSVSQGSGL